MDFQELAISRYSVRKFTDQPVDQEKIEKILAIARVAPTAVNKQPQRIMVLQGASEMQELAKCTTYTFHAPAAFVVCYDAQKAWVRPFDGQNSGMIDASIIGTYLMLALHDLGLGATWVGHFDPAVLVASFHLPPDIIPVAVFPFGYPAPDARPSPKHTERLPLSDTVRYGSF